MTGNKNEIHFNCLKHLAKAALEGFCKINSKFYFGYFMSEN